jgi:hypothetical protein
MTVPGPSVKFISYHFVSEIIASTFDCWPLKLNLAGPTSIFSQEPLVLVADAQMAHPVPQEAQRIYPALLANIRTLHRMVFARDVHPVTSVPALL